MIGSKVTRILRNSQIQEEQIVTGVCDYIPYPLRGSSQLRIGIVGQSKTVINCLLWNEFFTKTLLKECQHMLLQSYASQSSLSGGAIFMKAYGKVHKMEEAVDWSSGVRHFVAKHSREGGEVELEGFNSKGSTKRVIISFDQYELDEEQHDIVLKTEDVMAVEPPVVSQEPGEALEEKNQNSMARLRAVSDSKASQSSLKTFKSNSEHPSNKENSKTATRKEKTKVLHQKRNQTIEVKQKQFQPVSQVKSSFKKKSKSHLTHARTVDSGGSKLSQLPLKSNLKETSNPLHGQTMPVLEGRSSNTNNAVLSKIISVKQELIFDLRERLRVQEEQYEELLHQQQYKHEQQLSGLTSNIKEILNKYESAQREQTNETIYLKERVRVLQQALERCEGQKERTVSRMEEMIENNRRLEGQVKSSSSKLSSMKQHYSEEIKTVLLTNSKTAQQMRGWVDRANNYAQKYHRLVESMRSVIPIE